MVRSLDEWYRWVDSCTSFVLLDGGLGHVLSERGNNMDASSLWSGQLLLSNPEELRAVSRQWLEAGSDLLLTATYQVSTDQLKLEHGLPRQTAEQVFMSAIKLLEAECLEFWKSQSATVHSLRRVPKVGVSLGPLSAMLPGLSEYSGSYDGVSFSDIVRFHTGRCETLESATKDSSVTNRVYCFETIGTEMESRAIASVMSQEERRHIPYWISFQCRDSNHLASGEKISTVVKKVISRSRKNLIAIGVNCVPLECTVELVRKVTETIHISASGLEDEKWRIDTVAYPNSGETYCSGQFIWPQGVPIQKESWAIAVRSCGARLLGGCCRVGPDRILALHQMR